MLNRKLNIKEKGFTLIELLVVIAIIGILSGVVLTSLKTARNKAVTARAVQEVDQTATALELYYNEYGEYPKTALGVGYGEERTPPDIPLWCNWDVSNEDEDGDGIPFLDPLETLGFMSKTPNTPGGVVFYVYSGDLTKDFSDSCGHCVYGKEGIRLLVAYDLPASIPGVTDNDFCDNPNYWDGGACPGEVGPYVYCTAVGPGI